MHHAALLALPAIHHDKNIRIHNGELDTTSKACIWQALEHLTTGIVLSYRSDLYHDALFVQKLQPIPQCWYYLIGDNGTTITESSQDVRMVRKHGRPYVFCCELVADNHRSGNYLQYIITDCTALFAA